MSEGLVGVWERLMSLFGHKRDELFAILASYDLTPPHGHLLSLLADEPMRMSDIAESLICDASYVTALVDRLEVLGFAERRSRPGDRRVKEIALTPTGVKAAARVVEGLTSLPPGFEILSDRERATLARLITKVVPEVDAAAFPFRPPRPPVPRTGR